MFVDVLTVVFVGVAVLLFVFVVLLFAFVLVVIELHMLALVDPSQHERDFWLCLLLNLPEAHLPLILSTEMLEINILFRPIDRAC